MLACRYDQEKLALALVEKDANLDAQNNEGWTALMFACCNDQEKVALALVERGVDINCKNKAGQTILMFAANSNQKDVVRVLLDEKVYADEVWNGGELQATALGLVRNAGFLEIVKMLEKVGALEILAYMEEL